MAELIRYLTRDGALIQVGVTYYLHAHLHDPRQALTLVRYERTGLSWLDGRPTSIWLLRDLRGHGFLCEAWQLSRIPPGELYAQLREQN